MRRLILPFIAILFLNSNSGAQSVGIGTNTPDSSAQLDISNSNKGFLPPRVTLSGTDDTLTILKPAKGLLVYNTADSGIGSARVYPGYYYWNNNEWYSLTNKGNAFGDMQYWNGTKWTMIPIGAEEAVLKVCNGIHTWGDCRIFRYNPVNNPNEVLITSNVPNSPQIGSNYFWAGTWTIGGAVSGRFLIKIDLSNIPANAIIDSARLSFFAVDPPPPVGNKTDAMFGTANSCFIQRITSSWTAAATTWNNQPSTTNVNEVTIPQSNSSFEDSKNLDVTQLVKDMIQFGNNGFLVRLQLENYYNIRQYASSFATNPDKRYKLVVYVHY
jgi:hypothetical protein